MLGVIISSVILVLLSIIAKIMIKIIDMIKDIKNDIVDLSKVLAKQNGVSLNLTETQKELKELIPSKKHTVFILLDGFGYNNGVTNAPSGAELSAFLIPSYVGINGIVVNLDDKYGIYDVNVGALILPTVFDKIYSITESGEKTYYISYNGEEKDLSIYLIENGLNNVDESGKLLTDSEPIQDNSRTTDVTTDETVEVVTE